MAGVKGEVAEEVGVGTRRQIPDETEHMDPSLPDTIVVSIGLTHNELGLLRGLVRTEHRRKCKQQDKAEEKFGAEYVSTAHDRKLDYLADLYEKLTPEGAKGSWYLEEL